VIYRGVLETVHGLGENIRGRTLGAIDDLTSSGPPGSGKSRYASIVDRGRMEVETGIARIHGYPDPHAGNVPHNEPGRMQMPHPTTGTSGSGHTTGTGPGGTGAGENDYDYHGRGGDVDGGVGKGANEYGADDGYGRPGVRNTEGQQPGIDPSTEMGPDPGRRGNLSPNRDPPHSVDSGAGPSSVLRAGTPTQQKTRQDFPSEELPPRPQGQATDNDQHG